MSIMDGMTIRYGRFDFLVDEGEARLLRFVFRGHRGKGPPIVKRFQSRAEAEAWARDGQFEGSVEEER